jgi:hypothetical protein
MRSQRSPLSVEAERTYKVSEVAAFLRVDKAAGYEIRDGAPPSPSPVISVLA